jgi:Tol biopolymer transport system component
VMAGRSAVSVILVALVGTVFVLAASAGSSEVRPQLLVRTSGGARLIDPWSGRSQSYPERVALHRPVFSPDGERIAFFKVTGPGRYDGQKEAWYELWTARWDGSQARRLSLFGGWPTWSPDGQTIAFAWDRPDVGGPRAPSGLYTVPSNGGNPNRLPLREPGGKDTSADNLVWSPDGRWIAMAARQILRQSPGVLSGIWVVRSDGSSARRIATPHRERLCSNADPGWVEYYKPQWRRDGRVTYTARTACGSTSPDSTWSVFATRPDGTGTIRILGPPLRPPREMSHRGIELETIAPDGLSSTYYDHDRDRFFIHLSGRTPKSLTYQVVGWRPR